MLQTWLAHQIPMRILTQVTLQQIQEQRDLGRQVAVPRVQGGNLQRRQGMVREHGA